MSAARFLPLAIATSLAAQTHDQVAGKAALQADAADLQRTKVTAHLQHPLDAGTNLLWCATMQLAWDELATVFGTPARLAEASPTGDGLAERLVGKDDLDPEAYVARAGRGRDHIVEQIRADLQRVFGGAASPRLLPESVPPDAILAYAYLWKHLPFELPFRRGDRPLRFGERDVASFGLWSWHGDRDEGRRMRQLKVLRYDGPQQFVVELLTKGKDDRLLVARVTPGQTLNETVAAVMRGLEKATALDMDHFDRFEMPKLDFDVTRKFTELLGHKFANEGFRDQELLAALQNVRFKLDENGAILKSEAALAVGAAAPGEPRRMICDGPFLLLLARRGRSQPYFALWVGNDELLVRAARPAAGVRAGGDR